MLNWWSENYHISLDQCVLVIGSLLHFLPNQNKGNLNKFVYSFFSNTRFISILHIFVSNTQYLEIIHALYWTSYVSTFFSVTKSPTSSRSPYNPGAGVNLVLRILPTTQMITLSINRSTIRYQHWSSVPPPKHLVY